MRNAPALSLPPAVAWDDGLRVIDQRRLPWAVDVVELRSVVAVVEALQTLAVRGALSIGVCGALGVVVGLREQPLGDMAGARARLTEISETIAAARPTAANLGWAVERVRNRAVRAEHPDELFDTALDEALTILAEEIDATRRMAEHGVPLLHGVRAVLTHCNTGRLACPGVGTALGVIYERCRAGDPLAVYATETRPLLQGARLTAWELQAEGIDVRVLPDAAAASAIVTGVVQAVIVGADRIASNGDTANKIGTLAHGLAARAADVPFYVVAPSSTFDPTIACGTQIPIEQRPADEVLDVGGTPVAPRGVAVYNPAFDVTPGTLVTAFVTERGVFRPPYDFRTEP